MSKADPADNISPRVPVTELFFALIRCGIGKEEQLPATPTEQEWHELFDIAKKQTLAGIYIKPHTTTETIKHQIKSIWTKRPRKSLQTPKYITTC